MTEKINFVHHIVNKKEIKEKGLNVSITGKAKV